jgi:hypothetical protein
LTPTGWRQRLAATARGGRRSLLALTANPVRAFVFALLVGYALAATYAVVTHWHFEDAGSYWSAALRLQAGGSLYFSSANPSDSALYWYSPWFAALWVPLTMLPHAAVMVGWSLVQVAALGYLLWPSRHPASVALSLLLMPDLLRTASTGNVQVPMLALLLAGLRTRWGPVVIGVAASLKVFPIILAVLYGWRGALIAVGTAAILVAPVLLFDLSGYPTRLLSTPLPLPLMWLVAVGGLTLAHTPYRKLGASLAVMFATPNWPPGMLGFLALARPMPEELSRISSETIPAASPAP